MKVDKNFDNIITKLLKDIDDLFLTATILMKEAIVRLNDNSEISDVGDNIEELNDCVFTFKECVRHVLEGELSHVIRAVHNRFLFNETLCEMDEPESLDNVGKFKWNLAVRILNDEVDVRMRDILYRLERAMAESIDRNNKVNFGG